MNVDIFINLIFIVALILIIIVTIKDTCKPYRYLWLVIWFILLLIFIFALIIDCIRCDKCHKSTCSCHKNNNKAKNSEVYIVL